MVMTHLLEQAGFDIDIAVRQILYRESALIVGSDVCNKTSFPTFPTGVKFNPYSFQRRCCTFDIDGSANRVAGFRRSVEGEIANQSGADRYTEYRMGIAAVCSMVGLDIDLSERGIMNDIASVYVRISDCYQISRAVRNQYPCTRNGIAGSLVVIDIALYLVDTGVNITERWGRKVFNFSGINGNIFPNTDYRCGNTGPVGPCCDRSRNREARGPPASAEV